MNRATLIRAAFVLAVICSTDMLGRVVCNDPFNQTQETIQQWGNTTTFDDLDLNTGLHHGGQCVTMGAVTTCGEEY